jgi:hypothetical protein
LKALDRTRTIYVDRPADEEAKRNLFQRFTAIIGK